MWLLTKELIDPMAESNGVAAVQEEFTDIRRAQPSATPHKVLEWAVERFHPRLTMATAFGAEGCVLLHLLSEIEPTVRVFNLDTGYQFPETLELRDRIAEQYGIEVEMVRPDTNVAEYEEALGGPLYVSKSDQMLLRSQDCAAAAEQPLGYGCLDPQRFGLTVVAPRRWVHKSWSKDHKFGLGKVNPLLTWTKRDV